MAGRDGTRTDLGTDTALKVQLQLLGVGHRAVDGLSQTGHLRLHLVNGHLDGRQDDLTTTSGHDLHTFLDVGEGVSGCTETMMMLHDARLYLTNPGNGACSLCLSVCLPLSLSFTLSSHIQSQYTNTGQTSPSADPIMPGHCCSEPVKSAHLPYAPPADHGTLAPGVSESMLRVSCSPSLLSKNVGLQLLRCLWSCVRFRFCLGMIFTQWLKKIFIDHAVPWVLVGSNYLGRNRECFVRTVPASEICEYPIVLRRAVECVRLVVVVQWYSSSFSLW